MAEVVDPAPHDFWHAPMPASTTIVIPERSSACRCGTEYIVSSLYCHACGVSRPELKDSGSFEIPGLAELSLLADRLQLSTPAVVAFLVGIFCIIGALAVSVFYSVRTLLDWQAIQMWRIEWLLAAVACFVAGCLLKK
jgi:hypothetical protein